MPVELFGDWKKAQAILATLAERFREASKKAVLQEANFLRAKIVEGLREQAPGGEAFKPLSALTIAIRSFEHFTGTKALLRRADLRNGIVVKPIGMDKGSLDGAGAFVGVLRTAMSKTGGPLVNIAEMNEKGAGPIVVPITPKSRAFFHAALAKAGLAVPGSGPSTGGVAIAIIRIPPRPFLRPPFEKFSQPDDVRARYFHRVAEMLKGDLGGA